jgi:hypothetical protein
MDKLALNPKESYTLCADGNRVSVEEVDPERCEHSCGLLDLLFPCGTLRVQIGGS